MVNLIIADEKIGYIVSQIPLIQFGKLSNTPQFGSGDKYELNRYLEIKKDGSYPLIWLMDSEEDNEDDGSRIQRDCVLIIATRETNSTLFSNQRYQLSFKNVLHPVTSYLIEGLQSSNFSFIVDDKWKIRRYRDHSDNERVGNSSNTVKNTIDLWDAVRLTCRVEFNDNCLKPIIWQSRN